MKTTKRTRFFASFLAAMMLAALSVVPSFAAGSGGTVVSGGGNALTTAGTNQAPTTASTTLTATFTGTAMTAQTITFATVPATIASGGTGAPSSPTAIGTGTSSGSATSQAATYAWAPPVGTYYVTAYCTNAAINYHTPTITVVVSAPAALPAPSAGANGGGGEVWNPLADLSDGTPPAAAPEIVATGWNGKNELVIDLTTEELILSSTNSGSGDFETAAYSIDGGAKWNAKPLDSKVIKKLLKTGGTLWLTTALDSKTKQPQKADTANSILAADVVKFGKVDPAVAATKLTPNYALKGIEEGKFVLTTKEGKAIGGSTILVAYSTDKGKTAIKDPVTEKEVWYEYDPGVGITVQPLDGSGKPVKATLIYKYAPTAKAAGSKIIKVGVSSEIKVPAVKADYKKEILKVKAGQNVYTNFFTTNADFTNAGNKGDLKAPIADKAFVFTKDNAKAGLNLHALIPAAGADNQVITVWTAATAKKPASGKLYYNLGHSAAPLDNFTVGAIQKGKYAQPKSVEGKFKATDPKWGKTVAAKTTSGVILRTKAAGKGQKPKYDDGTDAASPLQVTYDISGMTNLPAWTVDDSTQVAAGADAFFTIYGANDAKGKFAVEGIVLDDDYDVIKEQIAALEAASAFTDVDGTGAAVGTALPENDVYDSVQAQAEALVYTSNGGALVSDASNLANGDIGKFIFTVNTVSYVEGTTANPGADPAIAAKDGTYTFTVSVTLAVADPADTTNSAPAVPGPKVTTKQIKVKVKGS